MTITITRITEFQTTVPDDCEDIHAAVDMARLEANHYSVITHEEYSVATSAVTIEEVLTRGNCPLCGDGPCLGVPQGSYCGDVLA